ncbi:MAG: DUF3796 domain-containing protein [Cellulosilyticaceae bacterium]
MNTNHPFKKLLGDRFSYDLTPNTKPTYTRKINPLLGLLGFAGFLGFLGFLPPLGEIQFGFFFFSFFGFFGFYYEGKMSNTLIDERFQFNAYRANAIANKTGLVFIIFATIGIALRLQTASTTLSFLIAVIGLAFGLSIFLQQYLLYRFENEA